MEPDTVELFSVRIVNVHIKTAQLTRSIYRNHLYVIYTTNMDIHEPILMVN